MPMPSQLTNLKLKQFGSVVAAGKMLCALRRSLSLPLLPRRVWNRTAGVVT